MWRNVNDHRRLVDDLCPRCGSKNKGILTRVLFMAYSPFKMHRTGPRPVRSAPRGPSRSRPVFVNGVYVGKCSACGGPVYKPRGRRGRNPRLCERCRKE
jgi:hypothetical protein